jgi:hypothetical protein
MEIKIDIDESCKKCREALKYFKGLHTQNKDVYMNMNMKEYTLIDGLYLTPDFNSCGNLTHFHIMRADEETLANALKGIKIRKEESKKIKELKKKNAIQI